MVLCESLWTENKIDEFWRALAIFFPPQSVRNKCNSIRAVKEWPGKQGDHSSVSVTRFWIWWQSNRMNKDDLIMEVHKHHFRQSEKHMGMTMSCCQYISSVLMRGRKTWRLIMTSLRSVPGYELHRIKSPGNMKATKSSWWYLHAYMLKKKQTKKLSTWNSFWKEKTHGPWATTLAAVCMSRFS